MPKPPRPSASEVLRHNLLILVGLPSRIQHIVYIQCSWLHILWKYFGKYKMPSQRVPYAQSYYYNIDIQDDRRQPNCLCKHIEK